MNNDDGIDNVVLILAAMFLVPLALPVVVPQLRGWLQAHLLEWHIVVPSAAAAVNVPGTSVGLDLPRLLLLIAVLVAVIAVAGRTVASRRQS